MTRRSNATIKGALAASAAGALMVALPMAPAQADDHLVDPAGTWKLVGLQIGDAAVVPCPTPTTEFSERWY